MAYKIAFFGAKPYDIASFDKVNEKYNYDIRYYKGHLNPNNLVLTQDADAVCIFVNDTADAAVIDTMVNNGVKLLALRCAGFNNVDLKAAKGKLPVVRVPAYSPYAVAEYSLALMLSLNRKIHRAYWRTRDGNFSLNGLMGFDMHGKTIGIIGTGKIAKILIRMLKGFGMRILAYDLYPDMKFAEEESFSYVSLDELYRESDIISLHCPLTDQTKYMIDKNSIDKMKEGVMEEVKHIFKPEFINRVDEMIVFHALNKENIKDITKIMLKQFAKRVKNQMDMELCIADDVVDFISDKGFDKDYGARPIRRALQTELEDVLAEAVLMGDISIGDTVDVSLSCEGTKKKIVVKKKTFADEKK